MKKEIKKGLKATVSAWKRELPAAWVAALLFMIPPLCVLAAGGYSGYSPLKVNEFSVAQWSGGDEPEMIAVHLATGSDASQDKDAWDEEEWLDTEKASGSNAEKASGSGAKKAVRTGKRIQVEESPHTLNTRDTKIPDGQVKEESAAPVKPASASNAREG